MKTVNLVVGIFQHENGSIAITAKDKEGNKLFITGVNDNEGSERYHKNLFNHLKDILVKEGKWQD